MDGFCFNMDMNVFSLLIKSYNINRIYLIFSNDGNILLSYKDIVIYYFIDLVVYVIKCVYGGVGLKVRNLMMILFSFVGFL